MRLTRLPAACLALHVATAPASARFDFEALRELIATHHIQSVEQLLAALPEDLRAHYTLVFASRSLQAASPDSPRVILFGTDAQLIVTFNGEPAQRGFESLETLEFSTSSSSFALREVSFATAQDAPAVHISDPNPPRCLSCHGTPARPVWDTHPLWPGVYAERYGAGLSSAERRGMRRFMAAQPTHARYRFLLNASTLADDDRYTTSPHAAYSGQSIEAPNERLSALLATLNVRFILQRLAESPGFQAHLSLLLAAAGETCGSIAEFYPASMREQIAEDLRLFAAATAEADRRQALAKNLRVTHHSAARGKLTPATELTALRYVAESSLGISTRQWTLALERGSYDLSAPPSAVGFEQALYNWLVLTDPELARVAPYRTYTESDPYCSHLRRSSQTELTHWYATRSAPVRGGVAAGTYNAAPQLLQSCIACHGSNSTRSAAPPIPFDSPDLLAQHLRAGNYPHGSLLDEILFRLTQQAGADRMPRGLAVDRDAQRQLEDYFRDLAAAH